MQLVSTHDTFLEIVDTNISGCTFLDVIQYYFILLSLIIDRKEIATEPYALLRQILHRFLNTHFFVLLTAHIATKHEQIWAVRHGTMTFEEYRPAEARTRRY